MSQTENPNPWDGWEEATHNAELNGGELNLLNRVRAYQTIAESGIPLLVDNSAELLLKRLNTLLGGTGWMTQALRGLKSSAGVGTVDTVQMLQDLGDAREQLRSIRAMLWDLTQPQTPEETVQDGPNIHTRDHDAARRLIAVFRLTEEDSIG